MREIESESQQTLKCDKCDFEAKIYRIWTHTSQKIMKLRKIQKSVK